MDTVPAQLSTVFRSLVDDFQDQLNDIKQGHTALLKELDEVKTKQQQFQTALEALTPWREAMDTKLKNLEVKVESATESSDGAKDALGEMRSQRQGLREAVDNILEQHK